MFTQVISQSQNNYEFKTVHVFVVLRETFSGDNLFYTNDIVNGRKTIDTNWELMSVNIIDEIPKFATHFSKIYGQLWWRSFYRPMYLSLP